MCCYNALQNVLILNESSKCSENVSMARLNDTDKVPRHIRCLLWFECVFGNSISTANVLTVCGKVSMSPGPCLPEWTNSAMVGNELVIMRMD